MQAYNSQIICQKAKQKLYVVFNGNIKQLDSLATRKVSDTIGIERFEKPQNKRLKRKNNLWTHTKQCDVNKAWAYNNNVAHVEDLQGAMTSRTNCSEVIFVYERVYFLSFFVCCLPYIRLNE